LNATIKDNRDAGFGTFVDQPYFFAFRRAAQYFFIRALTALRWAADQVGFLRFGVAVLPAC
jgi:hypothetical protein